MDKIKKTRLVCLFVLVMFALSFLGNYIIVPSVHAATIFSSGFESGGFISDGWTGTYTEGSGSVSVVTSNPHHGTYNAKVTGATVNDVGYAYVEYARATTEFVRFYFNITGLTLANGDYVYIGEKWTTGAWYIWRIGIQDATRKLRFLYGNNSNLWTTLTSATTISLNTFYAIEIKNVQAAGSGEYRVYLNGVEVADLAATGLNTNLADGNSRLRLGNAMARSYSGGMTINYDCVVTANTYIGVESASGVSFGAKGTNSTLISHPCKFYAYATALSGNLSHYIVSTNNTGPWQNETTTAFPSGVVSGWANKTLTLNSTVGVKVQSKIFANTTGGVWSNTGLMSLTTSAEQNVVYAESGSATGIQTAVNTVTAMGGGTVMVPEGIYDFDIDLATLRFDNTYAGVLITGGVNIIGAGVGQTVLFCNMATGGWNYSLATDQEMFLVNGANGNPVRISGISFNGSMSYVTGADDDRYLAAISVKNTVNFRIDNCAFKDFCHMAISVGGNSKGVIDHNTIDNPYRDRFLPHNQSASQPWALWGYGILLTWDYSTWRSIETLFGVYELGTTYIEDNNFTRTRHAIAANGVAFYVARYNYFEKCFYGATDVHGGARGHEVYFNTYNLTDESYSLGQDAAIEPRGGSGVAWNNTVILNSTVTGTDTVQFGNDGSPPPKDPVSNYYIWNNSAHWSNGTSVSFNSEFNFDTMPAGYVENVTYFLRKPNQGQDGFTYTAYTYPHPLTQGSSPSAPMFYGTSVSPTTASSTATVSIGITDTDGVSHAILSTNITNTWINKTAKTPPQATTTWAFNDTIALPKIAGLTVFYKIFANDTTGNMNVTSTLSFEITAPLTMTSDILCWLPNLDTYINFESTTTLTSAERIGDYWYFNGYGFKVKVANMTINSFMENEDLILTLNGSGTSYTYIYVGNKGSPLNVVGAVTWNYTEATKIIAITVEHSSPEIIEIHWNTVMSNIIANFNAGFLLLGIAFIAGIGMVLVMAAKTQNVNVAFLGIIVMMGIVIIVIFAVANRMFVLIP